MRSYLAIALCIFCPFLGSTAFLMNEGWNTYNQDCLPPPACQGCGKYVAYSPFLVTSAYLITCSSAGMTTFPVVNPINLSYADIRIDYSGNHLTRVPGKVFHNIQLTGRSSVDIDLGSNSISVVDLRAFDGISDRIKSLDISNNSLTNIPSALNTLHNLTFLHLKGNPIGYVDNTVMSSFSQSLTWLDIDFGHLSSWPRVFNALQVLETLEIYDITMELNDMNIFNGFASSLTDLTLLYRVRDHGSNFQIIPPAVTDLNKLNSLTVGGEVYCTCSLLYLKSWRMPRNVRSPHHAYMACHDSNYHNVDDYIYYIDNHCP